MSVGAATDGDLVAALAAFDRRARAYTPNAWRARGRSDVALDLAARLVELSRQAGDDVPAGTPGPQVGEHALADVVAVLGNDLLAALAARPDAELSATATQAVADALTALEATARS